MIQFTNINKTFQDKEVLKNVTGTFVQGKCNLIIGASGTGKSVLLKCLVGLVKPDTGSIQYDGREFTNVQNDTKQAIRRDIGMLFQGGALFDSKTVEENVMFPLDMLTKMSKSEKYDRVNYCLQRVGLDNVNMLKPSQISGGMQKRVGIARAIAMNSKYLYCDEPNSGLDPQTSILIDTLIKDITDEYNITTVVVTHDMNSVLSIGDNVLFMYKGEKVWEGTKTNILDTNIKSLQDFLFANKLIREMKAHNK
ncbi:MAG TPA: ATP-binding cassette domain-containing protein [Cytophagaceae bacterium]|jgi:phospholipid/cholesterol/gamma-HCH transport system ATP-binding protein|nr:ATP-binding cassette domain-containing protein [Cytophagaceae bacterium]